MHSTVHVLINAPIKINCECWMVYHKNVKNRVCDKVAHKLCTQKYRDSWVGACKSSVKIALYRPRWCMYKTGELIRLATVLYLQCDG